MDINNFTFDDLAFLDTESFCRFLTKVDLSDLVCALKFRGEDHPIRQKILSNVNERCKRIYLEGFELSDYSKEDVLFAEDKIINIVKEMLANKEISFEKNN